MLQRAAQVLQKRDENRVALLKDVRYAMLVHAETHVQMTASCMPERAVSRGKSRTAADRIEWQRKRDAHVVQYEFTRSGH